MSYKTVENRTEENINIIDLFARKDSLKDKEPSPHTNELFLDPVSTDLSSINEAIKQEIIRELVVACKLEHGTTRQHVSEKN